MKEGSAGYRGSPRLVLGHLAQISMNNTEQQALFIIFGGTGDLAQRKLYPSLFNLYKRGYLKNHFAVIGTARRPWTDEHYHEVIKESIADLSDDEEKANDFANHFYYQSHNVNDTNHYVTLRDLADKLDEKYGLCGNRLYYLAMSPRFFGTICEHLKTQEIITKNGYNRVVVEKPFGHDYESAKALNDEIGSVFPERDVFRIDHYLGKEMVQNILAVRFGNSMFNAMWNNRYISNIQITLSEALGVEERAGYYETSGALRDMVQNHILQIVTLLTMNAPVSYSAEDISREKINALKSLKVYNADEVKENFVRGQYGNVAGLKAYRDEDQVASDSMTETFVAGKLAVENMDFAGVPIYIRTGKRMKEKATRIDVVFKQMPVVVFKDSCLKSDVLTINVDPEPGISIQLNTKKVGQNFDTESIDIGYSLSDEQKAEMPEAYERLILNALRGETMNFARWDELSYSWKFLDSIRKAWDDEDLSVDAFPNYACKTMGPKASDELLEKDGNHWEF